LRTASEKGVEKKLAQLEDEEEVDAITEEES